MADIRVLVGRRSREPGTTVGVRLNTFGMSKLEAGVTGAALAQIALDAYQPSFDEAVGNWPVDTGASRDSIELGISEIGAHHARVILQAGGDKLRSDSRNPTGKDYAPFIEFNGTLYAPAGILLNAVANRDADIRREIHSAVSDLVRSIVSAQ